MTTLTPDDLLADFLAETSTQLDALDRDLVHLEQAPQDHECLARIFRVFHSMKGSCGFLGFSQLERAAHDGENMLDDLRQGRAKVDAQTISQILHATDRVKERVAAIAQTGRDDIAAPNAIHTDQHSIRIKTESLDRLLDLVSDLLLTRNRVKDTQSDVLQHLTHSLHDVQDLAMTMRLQNLDTLFGRMPRLLRDLAQQAGKDVTIRITGAETKLDRQVIEQMADPLLHLLRNAVVHGIEDAETRRQNGKTLRGHITLSAQPQNDTVIITLQDDGRGLDLQRIRDKAVAQGLLSAQDAAQADDAQLQRLIFTTGFSTASDVTLLAGRGVGLDAARHQIEQLGGSLSVDTRARQYTRFTITLPLTLHILPALLIAHNGAKLALPQRLIRDIVRLTPNNRHDLLGHRHLRWRHHLLPLLDLGALLNQDAAAHYAVILEIADLRFALAIEKPQTSAEIVVKNLPPLLRGQNLFMGQTILPDGSVAVVLDGNALARFAPATALVEAETAQPEPGIPTEDVLLFHTDHELALPLSSVAHLTRAERATIVPSSQGLVMPWRDGTLRVIDLTHQPRDKNALIVLRDDHPVGLLVDRVTGIAQIPIQDGAALRVADRVVERLDPSRIGDWV